MNADAVRITAGQQAAREAEQTGCATWKLRKMRPCDREPIEVGRVEAFRAENADIGVALVIGKDDDDVGKLSAGGRSEGGSGVKEHPRNITPIKMD